MAESINMETFVKEFQKEIVGEEMTIRFLLLVLSSKWVNNCNPLSFHTLLNSESGTGKDFVLQKVFKLIEGTDYVGFTRISARALDYLNPKDLYLSPQNTWSKKFLGLEDIESDILNSSTLKVFLSNGSKTAIVTDKGVMTTSFKGSPVIIMTSAYSDPNKELMRRINILNLDETNEQTAEILHRQALVNPLKINYDALKGLISDYKVYDVRIEYAFRIAKIMSKNGTHMRTFFPRFLDFIKASCLLNQKNRKKENNLIFATGEDYDVVRELFLNLALTQSFNPISRRKKQMLETLTYEFEGSWFSTQDASKILNKSYHAMFYIIKRFMDDGLLETKAERNEFSKKPTYLYKPIAPKNICLPKFNELVDDEN